MDRFVQPEGTPEAAGEVRYVPSTDTGAANQGGAIIYHGAMEEGEVEPPAAGLREAPLR